ncbi:MULTISPECIES: 2-hydroxyacid dehydrogenase [Olivibacter]|uniref:2-hydroxyacid dehydrogenase n=1 Tax=Olivibacter oleidegradans TaxID=760123 RepID=A0ABV6HSM4_9SPHI|nr:MULTISPECIES: 2-hydroxyacid dehydrogenase [Olivibacter]QEL04080.1 hydroxyacid dehydrogenase [Olivibacter sp. LS-1]
MKILITAPYNEKAQGELKELFGEIIYREWKIKGSAYTEEELIALLTEEQPDALITEHDQVTEKVIATFPHLKFIGVCRGTPSNVAINKATELGIPVFNTPARNAQAVAEMFIANLITFMRNTLAGIKWLEAKKWEAGAHASYLQFKGHELAGKKVGMVGFGAVGQTIANLLQHFPTDIVYYDPYYTSENVNFKKVSLEEVFSTADIVGIHLPVTEQTKGMINKDLISKMKADAIFVNTARAVVVNRVDLLQALTEGKIGGAILDVFDHEPPDEMDYKLIHHERVLATPHIAGATFEVEDHHADIMNNCLKEFFKNGNKRIKQLVNKEI